MDLQINKTVFLEVEKISSIKNHIEKIKHEQLNNILKCKLEVDISYRDLEFNECFKSITYPFEVELAEGLNAIDVRLSKLFIYVVEASGINVEYELNLNCEEKIENKEYKVTKEPEMVIEKNQDEEENMYEDALVEEYEEVAASTPVSKDIEIEKAKEEISKNYEEQLASNLASRENNVKIITTKDKRNELDFLKFFDKNENKYKVKTVLCESEDELNEISKKYKIPINDLLKGYDRANKRVVFKLITSTSD